VPIDLDRGLCFEPCLTAEHPDLLLVKELSVPNDPGKEVFLQFLKP
jgi:hypothetical protein